jgi:hypothetical protein
MDRGTAGQPAGLGERGEGPKKLIARPERIFLFRLAALFGCTVRELVERMTLHELAEWKAYDMIEPFGEGRLNLSLGNFAALTANINRDPKRGEPFALEDFVPFHQKAPLPPPRQPTRTQRSLFDRTFKQFLLRHTHPKDRPHGG